MTASPLRVVFFGNAEGLFANRHFDALRETSCVIAAVVDVPADKRASTHDSPSPAAAGFARAAVANGVPSYAPTSANEPWFVAEMAAVAPDLLVAVGYTQLLKAELLAVPAVAAVNFHASLLPAYRGKHPLFWALRHGERWVGLTVHAMAAGFDTGDILYQVRVRTRRSDSVTSLYERVMARSVPLVPRLIDDAAHNRLHFRPQPPAGASYFSAVTDADYRLDWSLPAALLSRWVHASPGRCYCDTPSGRLFVLAAGAAPGQPGVGPGCLAGIGRRTCRVAAGTGSLRLQTVRPAGGEAQPAAQWCRRVKLALGGPIEPEHRP